MRLPWVSRAAFDWNNDALTTAALRWANEYERLGRRYDELLEKYHALALPVLPVMATPVVREPAKPSVIAQAIRDESVGDPRLAAFLRNRSREIKLEHPNWTDDAIATELARWETTADQDAPT